MDTKDYVLDLINQIIVALDELEKPVLKLFDKASTLVAAATKVSHAGRDVDRDKLIGFVRKMKKLEIEDIALAAIVKKEMELRSEDSNGMLEMLASVVGSIPELMNKIPSVMTDFSPGGNSPMSLEQLDELISNFQAAKEQQDD